jgi:hypothetical protein
VFVRDHLYDVYRGAAEGALAEMSRSEGLPDACPWTLAQILDTGFYPDSLA